MTDQQEHEPVEAGRPGPSRRTSAGGCCPQCGAAVADVRLHEAWHRREVRHEREAVVLQDEVDALRSRLYDQPEAGS